MTPLRRLSRLAMIPTAPVLLAQGRRLRRDTPRLPDASQPWHGTLDGPDPLRLLVIGDSTAAGVGADTQDEALPGNLGRELSALTGRGVDWTATGRNGANARDLITDYLDDATASTWDVVFLTIGANDALGLRPRGGFARDIRTLLTRLRAVSPVVLVSSLPAFFRFELLPDPLRWNLYLHSTSLEDAARAVAATMPGVHMSPPPPPYTEGFFATDLFHPSALGYRDWARFAIEDAVKAGGTVILRSIPEIVAAIPTGERVVVGIAGAPGAGKSTVAAAVVAALPSAVLLPMDGFHLPQAQLVELARRERMGAPDTFDVAAFVTTLTRVRNAGESTFAPGFDRRIEEPVPDAIEISPESRTVVVEGNYLLHWPGIAALLDTTFVVEVDHDVRIERLIRRHVRYGKTPDEARAWSLGPDERNALLIAETAARANHVIRLD